jgi:phenylpropionate dioxygenase-like ring-hydroxylating dioxygenase large terminal subunit
MNMLQGSPWLLAHKSMLEKDKPRKISLYGKDYVIWKDRQEKISAIKNM